MGTFIFGLILVIGGIIGLITAIKMSETVGRGERNNVKTPLKYVGIGVGVIGFVFIAASTMNYVGDNEAGVMIKKFGSALPPGAIVAQHGECGPQAEILSPGWYFWIWPWMYEINKTPVVEIVAGGIGIVTAADGKPLSSGEVFAPEWQSISDMMDAQKFLSMGFKGPQLTVLTPGKYRFNPRLYTVVGKPALNIAVGYVAVVKANAGKLPQEADITEIVNGVALVPKGYRGIWKEPLLPNMYYLNTDAYNFTLIQTTNRVYEYSEVEDKKMSDPIMVRSSDGFTYPVDVRCAVCVDASSAPYVVAMLADPDAMMTDGEDKGRICILEGRCILPAIRNTLRNVSEKMTAFQFVDTRSDVEKQTSTAFTESMKSFRIRSEGIYIGQIDFDHNPQIKALMQTRTDREVAINQKRMYEEQEKAQQQRANLTKAEEQANQQKNLVTSQFEVQINTQKALARAAEAEGEAKYIEITFNARQKAYQQLATAIGQEGVTMLELFKIVKEGNIKITPEVMMSGGGSPIDALAGTMLRQKPEAKTDGKAVK